MGNKIGKTFQCGKCGNLYQYGAGGHNAASCGQTQKFKPSPQRKFIRKVTPISQSLQQISQQNTVNESFKKVETVTQTKRLVPQHLVVPNSISVQRGIGTVVFTPTDKSLMIYNKEAIPLLEGWLKQYNCISDGNKTVYFDELGLAHREIEPAQIHSGGTKIWWNHGNLHRIDGPAEIYPGFQKWWVNGLELEKHANHPSLPKIMGDNFYLLCTHSNPKIRRKALANPNCPPAWKVAAHLST